MSVESKRHAALELLHSSNKHEANYLKLLGQPKFTWDVPKEVKPLYEKVLAFIEKGANLRCTGTSTDSNV